MLAAAARVPVLYRWKGEPVGAIEFELRCRFVNASIEPACASGSWDPALMCTGTRRLWRGAELSLRARSADAWSLAAEWDPIDVASEAIEAAAALGL